MDSPREYYLIIVALNVKLTCKRFNVSVSMMKTVDVFVHGRNMDKPEY